MTQTSRAEFKELVSQNEQGLTQPTFSIFIPVWNGSKWLEGALKSVLAQEYDSWELVIGDNASSDDLESIVASYTDSRIHYHRWPNHTGIFENYNRTMALCRNDWIHLLCVDDRLQPSCLRVIAERIQKAQAGHRLAAVVAAARRIDDEGRAADQPYYGLQGRRPMVEGIYDANRWLISASQPGLPPWNLGSVAISRQVLTEMGGFIRPEIGLCSDHELLLRVAAYGDIVYIDQELLDYTVSLTSDSNSREAQNRSSGDQLTPMAAALLSGLRIHEARRFVSQTARRDVYRGIAHSYLRRASQHRYRPGGRGRRAALIDLFRAFRYSPRLLLSPQIGLFAGALLLTPSSLYRRLIRTPVSESFLTRGLGVVVNAVSPEPGLASAAAVNPMELETALSGDKRDRSLHGTGESFDR